MSFGKRTDAQKTPRPSIRECLFPKRQGVAEVRSMSTDILVALLPLVVWAVYLYGARVITLVSISLVSSLLLDALVPILLRDRRKPPSLDTAVSSLITVLLLPATSPLWVPIFTSAVSVVFVKHLFGRLCKARLNGPAVAVCTVFLVFPQILASVSEAGAHLPAFSVSIGEFSPVAVDNISLLNKWILPEQSLLSSFAGLRSDVMGACSALLILSGAVYLIARRVIKPHYLIAYSAAVFIFASFLFPHYAITVILTDTDALFEVLKFVAYHLVCGNMLLCAVYLSSLSGGSCMTKRGAVVAGLIGGAVSFGVRFFFAVPIDALLSVIAVNLLARPIDLLLRPVPFGGAYTKKKRAGDCSSDKTGPAPTEDASQASEGASSENGAAPSSCASENGGSLSEPAELSADLPDPSVHTRLDQPEDSEDPTDSSGGAPTDDPTTEQSDSDGSDRAADESEIFSAHHLSPSEPLDTDN